MRRYKVLERESAEAEKTRRKIKAIGCLKPAPVHRMIETMTIKEIAKKDPDGLIARAYAFAEKAHAGQKRKSGEPYFNHPLATGEVLQSWHLDDATIAAGILHDTVEDTGVPLETIRKRIRRGGGVPCGRRHQARPHQVSRSARRDRRQDLL
jgi:hypothetical protein